MFSWFKSTDPSDFALLLQFECGFSLPEMWNIELAVLPNGFSICPQEHIYLMGLRYSSCLGWRRSEYMLKRWVGFCSAHVCLSCTRNWSLQNLNGPLQWGLGEQSEEMMEIYCSWDPNQEKVRTKMMIDKTRQLLNIKVKSNNQKLCSVQNQLIAELDSWVCFTQVGRACVSRALAAMGAPLYAQRWHILPSPV